MKLISENYLNKIIQCHLDINDPDTFIVGRVCWLSDEWFLVQEVSEYGQWNGISLYLQSDVVAATETSTYLHKLQHVLHERNEQPMPIPSLHKHPFPELIQYLNENRRMCAFELLRSGDRDVVGLVCSYSSNSICVSQITEDGEFDGESLICISAITRVFIGDYHLQYLEHLSSFNDRYSQDI